MNNSLILRIPALNPNNTWHNTAPLLLLASKDYRSYNPDLKWKNQDKSYKLCASTCALAFWGIPKYFFLKRVNGRQWQRGRISSLKDWGQRDNTGKRTPSEGRKNRYSTPKFPEKQYQTKSEAWHRRSRSHCKNACTVPINPLTHKAPTNHCISPFQSVPCLQTVCKYGKKLLFWNPIKSVQCTRF